MGLGYCHRLPGSFRSAGPHVDRLGALRPESGAVCAGVFRSLCVWVAPPRKAVRLWAAQSVANQSPAPAWPAARTCHAKCTSVLRPSYRRHRHSLSRATLGLPGGAAGPAARSHVPAAAPRHSLSPLPMGKPERVSLSPLPRGSWRGWHGMSMTKAGAEARARSAPASVRLQAKS